MHCTWINSERLSRSSPTISSKLCEWFDGRHWTGLLISHRLSMDRAMDCMDETVDRGVVDWSVDWSVDRMDWSVRGMD